MPKPAEAASDSFTALAFVANQKVLLSDEVHVLAYRS